MGVATGCRCKEIYRLPHTTYPYSSCIRSFCSRIMLIKKKIFPSLYIIIYREDFVQQYSS